MNLINNNNTISMTVVTKEFGSINFYLDDKKNKIGDGYYVTTTKQEKCLAGFIDIKGKEVIPLKEMELSEFFYTKNHQDICLGFKIPNTEILEYYHIKKQEEGNYKLVLKTNPFDKVPLRIKKVAEDPNVWIFEAIKIDPEYAIYSIEKQQFLTNFFHEISYDLEENPNHYIYFCKYITSEIPDINGELSTITHTSIQGFLNRDGSFSSQIYETEADLLYNSYFLGENSLSKEFKKFLLTLENKYLAEYNQKEEFIQNTINYLFENPNLSEKPKINTSKPTKIIEFKKKDK